MNARKQYLEEVGKEYSRADEKSRGRLLDEAAVVCRVVAIPVATLVAVAVAPVTTPPEGSVTVP